MQAKSDIYSLGLVLVEALTGQPIDMGGSQAAILEKRRKVPDLGAIDLRIRPLIAKMLDPDPAARPESMAQVATWPLPTSRPNDDRYAADLGRSGERRNASSGRTKWMALAAACGVIAIGGGAAYYVLQLGLPGLKQQPPPPPLLGPGASPAKSDFSATAALQPAAPAGPALTPASPAPPSTAAQPPAQIPAAPAAPALTRRRRPSPGGALADTGAACRPPNCLGGAAYGSALRAPTERTTASAGAALRRNPRRAPSAASPSKGATKEMAALQPVVGRAEQITRYINSYDGGDCFFITPNNVSASAARIDGYGASAAPFQRLDDAFKSATASKPISTSARSRQRSVRH